MIKLLFVFLAVVVFTSKLQAQLVIDSSSSSGYFVPFNEVQLSSISSNMFCTSITYPIDLTHDSITDVEILVSCYMGGFGNDHNISIRTYNNFYIHSNTSYLMNFQYIGTNGAVLDTSTIIPVAKKYEWGDTVNSGQTTLSTNLPIYRHSQGNSPGCTYSNIYPFLNDTAYIVLETSASELFYIKISNPTENNITLHSINSSALYLNNIIVYPNPAFETIHFDHSYKKVQIVDNYGCVVMNQLDVYENMDISSLLDGIYWIFAEDDEKTLKTKLVKISH